MYLLESKALYFRAYHVVRAGIVEIAVSGGSTVLNCANWWVSCKYIKTRAWPALVDDLFNCSSSVSTKTHQCHWEKKVFHWERKSSAYQSLENCSGLSIPVSTHEEKPKITAYCHDVTLCNKVIKNNLDIITYWVTFLQHCWEEKKGKILGLRFLERSTE